MADEATTTATVNGQPATIVINQAPATPTTKPGYATSEFWKTVVVSVFGMVMASGAIPATGFWGQIAGLIASVLVTLGYTQARAAVKTGSGS